MITSNFVEEHQKQFKPFLCKIGFHDWKKIEKTNTENTAAALLMFAFLPHYECTKCGKTK